MVVRQKRVYNKNIKGGAVSLEKACILVVDDDREIVKAVAINLENEGYEVVKAYDGLEALDIISSRSIQLIIIDVMMPRLDGLSATMKIRERKNIPIIIMSAKSEDSDKILGLSMGADDYITKPFNNLELMARVKSQLRRYITLGDINMQDKNSTIKVGRLTFDTEYRSLMVDGEAVKLTATETKIVELLMRNPGRVFPAEEIYQRVWQEPAFSPENTVMVHIRRIREKIEINPKEPEYLKVVWGIGYKIEKH
jgi:DNA-binding response OmpR family regulator